MKIVLFGLNGSYSHSNLAIRRLRVPLDKAGYNVELVEGNLHDVDSNLLDKLFYSNADVYGFSCYIWNISRMEYLAENLKRLNKECKIIFGGPEVSYDYDRYENKEYIDTIISGPGEKCICDICNDISSNIPLKKVYIEDDLILSNGILYDKNEATKVVYYESTVGCPYSCAYCLSSAIQGVKSKPVDQVIEELKEFESLDGTFIVKFIDRTFNYDIDRANTIWETMINNNFKKKYQFEVCASLLNEKSFELFSKCPENLIQLEAGLQSTNSETLKAVARHLDVDNTLSNCLKIRKNPNVHMHLDLIAGLPYENYESFIKSFNDAYNSCDLLQLGFLKLLHGTELRNKAEEYGIVYSSVPPYNVMKTKWISYEEIRILQEISDIMERLRDSNHFESSLDYLVELSTSPYEFYYGFYSYLKEKDGRPIRKIGQRDVYKFLYSYALTIKDINELILEEKLHKDFNSSEVRKAPSFID